MGEIPANNPDQKKERGCFMPNGFGEREGAAWMNRFLRL